MIKAVAKSAMLIALLGPESADAYVRKEIPEHLQKKFGLIDPKAPDNRVVPEIKPEHLVPPKRDVMRKKGTDEIPRVPEDEIDVEEV